MPVLSRTNSLPRIELLVAPLCSVGALNNEDYWKTAIYFGVVALVYLLFSLPMSYIRHSRVDYTAAEELKWVVLRSLLHEGQQPDGAMALRCRVVELALVNGRWQPARLKQIFPSGIPMNPAVSTHSSGSLGTPFVAGSPTRTLSAAPSRTRTATLPPTDEARPCA